MRFRIALAQMKIANSLWRNLRKIKQMTEAARRRDADLVIFPETAASGLSLDMKDFDVNNSLRDHFADLAVENSIDMVPGSVIVPIRGKRYNTAYYIDRRGRELARYHKRNLWVSERKVIEPGLKHVVAKTRFGKVGLAICWDLVRPDLFYPLVKEGAEIIACPSYWWYGPGKLAPASPGVIKGLAVARAFESLCIVAYCNAAGKDRKGRTLLGRSQIVQPFTENRVLLDHNREGLLVGEVDTGRIKKLEKDLLIRHGIKNL